PQRQRPWRRQHRRDEGAGPAVTDFVLDCSVAMTWCFEDEACAYGDKALDQLAAGATAVVPQLWLSEVANVLLVAERRHRLTKRKADAFVARLGDLPIVVWDGQAVFGDVLE